MKEYLVKHPWHIIEDKYNPAYQQISESIFSIGNGRMGQRGNFEEDYSGETLQGNYLAGIYYPDKTRVGWWKNGYPEYFAKVLNSVNWIGLHISIDGVLVDLNRCQVVSFERVLDMKQGTLRRTCRVDISNNRIIKIASERFYHAEKKDLGFLKYELTPENFSGKIDIVSYLDFDIMNQDSNYDEKFWIEESQFEKADNMFVRAITKKTGFDVCAGLHNSFYINNTHVQSASQIETREKYISNAQRFELNQGEVLTLIKTAAIVSSFYYSSNDLEEICIDTLEKAKNIGFDAALSEHINAWSEKWNNSDIIIDGDVSAQQGIRFNIFHMHQTYSGDDHRLNIGPKGFTGEKYGGSTYWDTEAYCLPFYLSTTDQQVSRNLLVYRYKHLKKAIENAELLGFTDGAALYPMVTMNGEECHNEWEITFEEIHRNGAIAYAIFDYIRYTGDSAYLAEYGLEVLIGIARFWAQRVNWSEPKQQFVMLGVTGPNEYENNVNNNWYTNYIARWCLQYTTECIDYVRTEHASDFAGIMAKTNFDLQLELEKWKEISANIYLPETKDLGIYLQQDGYLDKEQIMVSELDKKHLPINQNWSWDRILRSCFIKQADVLQGIYFFEEEFSLEELSRNYDFYEPRTVHESSLSPCIHSILASKLGRQDKAYEMYLRTARLDLDDYNNDTEDGLHITSMAGTWLAVVKGFAGMKIQDDKLSFNPFIPEQWKSYRFEILFRGHHLEIAVNKEGVEILESNPLGKELTLQVFGNEYTFTDQLIVPSPLSHA